MLLGHMHIYTDTDICIYLRLKATACTIACSKSNLTSQFLNLYIFKFVNIYNVVITYALLMYVSFHVKHARATLTESNGIQIIHSFIIIIHTHTHTHTHTYICVHTQVHAWRHKYTHQYQYAIKCISSCFNMSLVSSLNI